MRFLTLDNYMKLYTLLFLCIMLVSCLPEEEDLPSHSIEGEVVAYDQEKKRFQILEGVKVTLLIDNVNESVITDFKWNLYVQRFRINGD